MDMKYKNTGGLTIKNGRLINDREPGMTGIQQAANIKQTMKRVKEVNMIADGIELAEGRKGFYR